MKIEIKILLVTLFISSQVCSTKYMGSKSRLWRVFEQVLLAFQLEARVSWVGIDDFQFYHQDFWEWDQNLNVWTQKG